jgi:predicted CoA-binding protein
MRASAPLYFATEVAGVELWAWNREHLIMIADVLDGGRPSAHRFGYFATYLHGSGCSARGGLRSRRPLGSSLRARTPMRPERADPDPYYHPRMAELTTDAEIAAVLRDTKTIAILGAHHEASRPACYVPEYLHAHGYRVLPVNPMLAGRELWGQTIRASLADLRDPVDIVDVFRRTELLPAHLDEILAMSPRPRVVWLQQGIRNDAFARSLEAAGIDVVQDRCTLAEHRRLGMGRS